MSDYNDGKIHGWNGGPCPVHPKTEVEFWTRESGSVCADTHSCFGRPVDYSMDIWEHARWDSDVIAFKVLTPYVEPVPPKTIWVNEYFNGQFAAHRTEDSAKKHAGVCSGRVAVKYVEVKE